MITTIAKKREKLEDKIWKIEEKLFRLNTKLEDLRAKCPHEGVKWLQTSCSNIEDFHCETCGKYENRVWDFRKVKKK